MDKLIELLNEYDNIEKYGIKRKIGTDPIGIYGYLNGYGLGFTSKARIISKDYGFIKRLVDNDKIDRDKAYILHNARKDIQTDKVIMLLAIQENAIEFLISILK